MEHLFRPKMLCSVVGVLLLRLTEICFKMRCFEKLCKNANLYSPLETE